MANPIILPLGMFAIVAFALSRRPSHAGAREIEETELERLLARVRLGVATRRELAEAIKIAEGLGYMVISMRLRALLAASKPKPKPKPEAEAKPTPKPRKPKPTLPRLIKSPFRGVSNTAWRDFARAMSHTPVGYVSPDYHFGAFYMGPRSLEDFGVMKNARKGTAAAIGKYDGKKKVWIGDWVPPYSLDRFLSDPALQVEMWNRLNRRNYGIIRRNHAAEIGSKILGKEATISGLLAAMAIAGPTGFKRFLTSTDEARKKFPTTASHFKRANGLF